MVVAELFGRSPAGKGFESFLDLARNRYSVGSFTKAAVEEEKLNAVLEAARLAPTAANRQPFRLIVVHTAGKEEELGRIYAKSFFLEAPLLICACTVPSEAWTRPMGRTTVMWTWQSPSTPDAAAASLGLGTTGSPPSIPARRVRPGHP